MLFMKSSVFTEKSYTEIARSIYNSARPKFEIFCKRERSRLTNSLLRGNRGIYADVIVYIFADLHPALLTEINMLDMN